MGVTKTDFMRALQCPKMLWLDKHHPEFKIIPPEIQKKLDEGNIFGDKAMGMFGDYTEVTTRNALGRLDCKTMIEKTKECLLNGTGVICEASFDYRGNYCAVDILKKTNTGYEMYEVKNASEVTESFVVDLAFQRYLLERCGMRVEKASIVFNGEDESKTYRISDQTKATEKLFWMIDEHIWRYGLIKKQNDEYIQEVGEHCEYPYRCWYWDYCHNDINQ